MNILVRLGISRKPAGILVSNQIIKWKLRQHSTHLERVQAGVQIGNGGAEPSPHVVDRRVGQETLPEAHIHQGHRVVELGRRVVDHRRAHIQRRLGPVVTVDLLRRRARIISKLANRLDCNLDARNQAAFPCQSTLTLDAGAWM